MRVDTSQIATPVGPMLLGATTEAACVAEFADLPRLDRQMDRLARRLGCTFVPGSNPVLRELASELAAWFEGRLHAFRTPLLLPGTEFQRAVWEAIGDVPYGETCSYGALAKAVGRPTASRAVAQATGANRLAILVPCHRIVGADGGLTGYGGGLARKARLLGIERDSLLQGTTHPATGHPPANRPERGGATGPGARPA